MKMSSAWPALAVLLAAGHVQAPAAEILVPGGQANVVDALVAAQPGDTIRITDSGTYNGDLNITKPVTIIADPGRTPVIVTNGVQTHGIHFQEGSQGSRIGSNSGGVITVDGDADHGFAYRYLSTPGEITLENVVGRNFGINHGFQFTAVGDVASTFTIRNVRIADFAHLKNVASFFNLSGGAVVFEDCSFRHTAATNMFDTQTNGAGTIKFIRCILDADRSVLFARRDGTSPTNIEIRDSVVITRDPTNGTHRTFNLDSDFGNSTMNITNSALVGAASVLDVDTNNLFLNVDHCDLFSRIYQWPVIAHRTNANTIVRVRNSNLNNPGDASLPVGGTATGWGFYVYLTTPVQDSSNFNNYNVSGTALYGAPGSNFALGADDITSPGLNPGYVDTVNHDYMYSEPAELLSGDESGGPIGSHFNFLTQVPVELSAFGVM